MTKPQDEPTVRMKSGDRSETGLQETDSMLSAQPDQQPQDIFADLEETLNQVAEAHPRIDQDRPESPKAVTDLKALLEVSLAVNSSLVVDDVLQIVMNKAIELMQAERGLIMLLNDSGELQVRSAYNLHKEEIMDENFKISRSITNQVASTGKSVYTSDALADERYATKQSVVELHLRSIMCVPLMLKERVIGVIYLDNSNQAKMFLKSDLYLFELYAQMVSNALHNAHMYDSQLRLKRYNELVVSKSPVGIIVIDSSGRLATINSIALEIFELNRDKISLVGEPDEPSRFLDLLPTPERPRWKSMIDTTLTTGQDYADPRFFHNTGFVEKALSVKVSPLPNLLNGADGVIMTVEDITEKVLMEKYVILSEKLVAKGEMAAAVAHELNNYLAIASNNAELMALNLERGKREKAVFNSKSVTENIRKIKRFVDNLMDFSKPESEFISYDIKHLIEDLLFSLRIQPRFKRVHFTIDLSHDIPNLEIDVGLIQQVLMNLLNNAADAIEERAITEESEGREFKREIGITARYDRGNEQASVEITDNGPGMTEEILSNIFAMHFTTKKGGHGLGLSNCKKIIDQHRGQLTARSKPGEGATFTVVLPRFQPAKNPAQVHEQPA
ncbi:MAG: ATP-binding protein [Candidatus Zixiibacteriota bacterium]